ncbi:hypothetical protein DFH08DRAFT_823556 [Mycena albidolilacea]|uniref:Uncharacterized protein n=1 Tax=Mycena albidolilacea TaxID=1033008 RepID=A0AAD6Z6E2_9AGAR|nr:hypothetical protein DFH08DRAFT_823556 [Mycena albidolilacea]
MYISGRSMPFAESASLSDQLKTPIFCIYRTTGGCARAQKRMPLGNCPSIFAAHREFNLTLNDQRADALEKVITRFAIIDNLNGCTIQSDQGVRSHSHSMSESLPKDKEKKTFRTSKEI